MTDQAGRCHGDVRPSYPARRMPARPSFSGDPVPCPTCDHMMSRLGCQYAECVGSWACPRCGTLKIGHEDGHVDIIVPALVEACRKLEKLRPAKFGFAWPGNEWEQLGIAESINRPADRPKE